MYNHGAEEVMSLSLELCSLATEGTQELLVSEANDNFF